MNKENHKRVWKCLCGKVENVYYNQGDTLSESCPSCGRKGARRLIRDTRIQSHLINNI